MKTIILTFFLLTPFLAAASTPPQNGQAAALSENTFSAYAGMGIHILSAPSIVKYVNASGLAVSLAPDWGTAIEFFGGVEIPVSRSWGLKLEHSYLFKTYSLNSVVSGRNLQFDVQAPMALVQYVIPGKGFFIKLGGGGGYHWGTVTVPDRIAGETAYRASGIGMRAEAEGETAFDAHLFGYISGTIGFEALGNVTSATGLVPPQYGTEAVSLNYVTAGLRFGLMYYF